MKIWLVQMESKVNDKAGNLEKILNYVDRALAKEVNILAFPELALTSYMCKEKFFTLAETIPGPSTSEIAKRIRGKDLYVIFGMPELSSCRVFNSAPLVGPTGVVGTWRKLTLATARTATAVYEEDMYFYRGNEMPTFDTQFGKLGIHICRDIRYPEVTRCHSHRGAMIVLCISAAPGVVSEKFHVYSRSRAQEGLVWFGYANVAGEQDGVKFTGGSCLISPSGEIKKAASIGENAKEEIVEGEIDLDQTFRTRVTARLEAWRPEIIRQGADIVSEI